MRKIAFDLDGVLVPDCDEFPNVGGLEEFYQMSNYMRPLFLPQGPFAIITGRKARFRPYTWSWCKKYLDPLPIMLYHERLDSDTPEEYKLSVINSDPNITCYVESDAGIVDYLQQWVKTDCKIIHFADYLESRLQVDR